MRSIGVSGRNSFDCAVRPTLDTARAAATTRLEMMRMVVVLAQRVGVGLPTLVVGPPSFGMNWRRLKRQPCCVFT